MSLSMRYEGVEKVFDPQGDNPVRALNGVSFAIEPGEAVLPVGPQRVRENHLTPMYCRFGNDHRGPDLLR